MFHTLQSLFIFGCQLWFYTTIAPIIFLHSLFASTSKSPQKSTKYSKPAQTADTNTITAKHSFTHQWTIEHFGELVRDHLENHPIQSGAFAPPERISSKFDEKIEFELFVYPRNERDELGNLHVGVFLRATSEKQTQVRYRFWAIDCRSGQKFQSKCSRKMINSNDTQCYGHNKWIKHEDLFNAEKSYLSEEGGNLTIFCEIDILISKPLSSLNILARTQAKSKATFKENYKTNMLIDPQFSDISLVVAGGKALKAHKAILAAQSPVFKTMFSYTNIKEALEKRIEISDLTEEVCRELLRFIYTGSVKHLKQITTEQLFSASDKYQLDHLKSLCEKTLCTQLTSENAEQIYKLAYLHNSPKLMKNASDFTDRKTMEKLKKILHKRNRGMSFEANRLIGDLASKVQVEVDLE